MNGEAEVTAESLVQSALKWPKSPRELRDFISDYVDKLLDSHKRSCIAKNVPLHADLLLEGNNTVDQIDQMFKRYNSMKVDGTRVQILYKDYWYPVDLDDVHPPFIPGELLEDGEGDQTIEIFQGLTNQVLVDVEVEVDIIPEEPEEPESPEEGPDGVRVSRILTNHPDSLLYDLRKAEKKAALVPVLKETRIVKEQRAEAGSIVFWKNTENIHSVWERQLRKLPFDIYAVSPYTWITLLFMVGGPALQILIAMFKDVWWWETDVRYSGGLTFFAYVLVLFL